MIDTLTNTYVKAASFTSNLPLPKLFSVDNKYSNLLKEFPSLLSEPHYNKLIKRSTVRRVATEVPPTFSRHRRLDPLTTKIGKSEFEFLINSSIRRPFNCRFCSPLRLIPKKESNDWRPCTNLRRLNRVTIPDRYPLPYIHDLNITVLSQTVFPNRIY